MKRFQIMLSEPIMKVLQTISAEKDVSISEIVRRIIEDSKEFRKHKGE